MSPALLLGSWLREETQNPSKSTRFTRRHLPSDITGASQKADSAEPGTGFDAGASARGFCLPEGGGKEMLAPLADERTWSD